MGRAVPLSLSGLSIAAFGMTATAGGLVMAFAAIDHTSYDIGGAMLAFPVLFLLSVPVIGLASRQDDAFRRLLYMSLLAKAMFTYFRYVVIFDVYGGNADASRYHNVGAQLSDRWRLGQIGFGSVLPLARGTAFVERLTATVYSAVGPSRFAGFLVFSWLSWIGLVLFTRALQIGYPVGNHRPYQIGALFLPSLLFWPSSLGKESWMLLTLGLSAYGAARLLRHLRGGLTVAFLGIFGAGVVRSHVSAVLLAALAAAMAIRSQRGKAFLGRTAHVAGVAAVIVAMSFAVSHAGKDLGTGGSTGITSALTRTSAQTNKGNSTFDVTKPNSPLQYPAALATVLFRPTLIEARNATQLVAALETTLFAVMAALSWRRILGIPRLVRQYPYLLFAAVFVIIFGFAWSSISNFGILARQRAQVLPFLWVLIALPRVLPDARGSAVEAVELSVANSRSSRGTRSSLAG